MLDIKSLFEILTPGSVQAYRGVPFPVIRGTEVKQLLLPPFFFASAASLSGDFNVS